MEQHIVIGKIVAPHGVRGEFRIMPQTDHPERYAKMKKIVSGEIFLTRDGKRLSWKCIW